MPSNIRYQVNPEKRTVACYLTDCENDIFYAFNPKENSVIWDLNVDWKIKDRYVGVAKCSEDDTFDEEFGKKLARNRMLKEYYKDVSDRYMEIVDVLNGFAYNFYLKYDKYSTRMIKKVEEIEEQLK